MSIGKILDPVHRIVAKSSVLVNFAILLRNQCRCVIKYHLAESPDTLATGETWLRELIAQTGLHFIDVGANIGDWTLALKKLAGAGAKFAAYEPSRSAFVILKEQFASDPFVQIFDSAVGDRPGTMTLLEESNAGKGSTLVPGLTRITGENRVVNVTTLDDEIERLGWPLVDCIKIDAEGYDFHVLRGAREALESHSIAVVQFEYNRAWQLAGDTLFGAMSFLKSRDYTTYLLKREGLFTLNYALYEEYFEYSNYVAIAPQFMRIFEPYVRGKI